MAHGTRAHTHIDEKRRWWLRAPQLAFEKCTDFSIETFSIVLSP